MFLHNMMSVMAPQPHPAEKAKADLD
uniref:Uncharacterized protein n=1 Tax=Anguilla anguilla TaxID=7936 RepID=A0A0E9QNG2_ANGAN